MKTRYLVHYQPLGSSVILMTEAVGETPDQATRQLSKAGEGVWRIVSVQEMHGLVPPDRRLLTLDEASEWTGFSTTKLNDRAGSMGIPYFKDGTICFPREHLEHWVQNKIRAGIKVA